MRTAFVGIHPRETGLTCRLAHSNVVSAPVGPFCFGQAQACLPWTSSEERVQERDSSAGQQVREQSCC